MSQTDTNDAQLVVAKHKQQKAFDKMRIAVTHLQEAQNDLTDIEGTGFGDAYTELGETYYRLQQLAAEVRNFKPTGIFDA